MSSRDSQGNTKEDKHLKYDIVDGQRKTVEKNFTVQKPGTTGNSQKQRTSNDGSVKQKSDNEKTKTKAVENKETKPMIIKKHVKNLKQSKRNFTNIFRPVTMRDAETMTDLLKIFETPSNSVVSVFKSSPASLQEIEVMTDLTGDEVAGEVGLKDVETTTDDLALTVLEMTNDLDYMNLKLLEDERERKMEYSDGVGGVLERDNNMLPEESSDGVYGDLLERMYICLGIAPVEIRKLGEAENETPADNKKVVKDVTEVEKEEEVMVESKSELLESLKSEEFETPSADDAESTDNLSQIRSSSMRSTLRESMDNSEIVEGVMEVNYEEDVKEEESVEVVVEEPEEHPSFEEGVPEDEDIVQEDNVEEPIIDVDEINEGPVYIELNETYHFRELFDVDESEVYVEENINFESEDDVYREQEAKGSYEQRYTFNIKGGEEIEKEESPNDILVRRATLSEDAITVIDRESDTDLYRSSLLAAVVVDEKYQSIIEKQFSDEEVQQFHEDDQELADTVEIDKLAGEVSDDYLDTFTELDLNYPRYDDEWEIPRVIEALCEDQSVGKILRDFGLLEELEDNEKSSHPTIATSETDSIIIGGHDSSMISFLDKATKYADQITDLSGLEAATWKASNQFRVSMIYNEEPGSHINENDIHALLKKEESASA
ncbi:hypothetical protein LSTR_LSTR009363 [Laodelphax striatellus]|uniref:Uncharacterized protein n=1 Tax=Laodelphax striatellus TaxID=195883 RepID=A0A482WNS8_LAOST|nr:hypothetical protein LSTR_LSTR009363 [Laodelphax striatellus]